MTTLSDIKRMISEETKKLNEIGYYPVPVNVVLLFKSRSRYADAWRSQGMIRVSEYYLSANPELIRATIMHELIHMIPSAGHGHGKSWKNIAEVVSEKYPQYDIKRCGSNLRGEPDFSLRAVANEVSSPRHVYVVKCPSCGRTWTRYRKSNLILNPQQYRCTCCNKPLINF